MRLLKQFMIILGISLVGELLHGLLPLPIPASVYGMCLMLLALLTRAIRPEQVKDAGHFLIEIMPVMFIPAGVGLMDSWDVLRPNLIPVLVIIEAVLIAVMVVSGLVAQAVIRLGGKGDAGNE